MKFPNPKDFYDEDGNLDLREYDREVSLFETALEERSEYERDRVNYTTELQNQKVDCIGGEG